MDDIKELIEDLKKAKENCDKMSKIYFHNGPLWWIDLETMRDHLDIGIGRLERDLERCQKPRKAA